MGSSSVAPLLSTLLVVLWPVKLAWAQPESGFQREIRRNGDQALPVHVHMTTADSSPRPAAATPDVVRLPFAFEPERNGDRIRVSLGSRALIDVGFWAASQASWLVPEGLGRAMERGWARLLARALDLTIDVSGLENIEPGQQYLVAPLHESFVDVPVLLHLPLDLRFTVREELMDHGVIGDLLHRTGQIIVPEEPSVATLRTLMHEITRAVQAEESVVVFPQGSVLGVEAAFSPGFFTLSRRMGLPILPVVLTGTHRVWGHPFDNVVRLHQTVVMHVLEPIPDGVADAEVFRRLERTMKGFALGQSGAPVRRFDPSRDGWWDCYAYEIDGDFPELVAAVASRRALLAASHTRVHPRF